MGDFVLQKSKWVEDKQNKGYRSIGLLYHILIHALLLLPLITTGSLLWWQYGLVLTSHYIIDLAKIYAMKWGREVLFFTLDQLLHIAIIVFVAYYPLSFTRLDQHTVQLYLTLAICLVLLSRVSGMIIHYILKPWSKQLEDEKEASLEKAGSFIGYLERLFVFFLLLFDQLSAIGFLLAAKSVFRFGDLQKSKGRKLTEYVLIGTMLSFGSAILIYFFFDFLGRNT
jgi:hypothetical protein